MATSLFDLLQRFSEQLPGCVHTSIVDRESGMAIAAVSEGDPLDSAGADAFHSDLYRLSQEALSGTVPNAPTGIVLTSKEVTFVSRPLDDSRFIWLVVTRRSTTVGFTQAIMRKKIDEVQAAIRALV